MQTLQPPSARAPALATTCLLLFAVAVVAQLPCPPGQYGPPIDCRLCPAGRYGATQNVTSINCTGPCAAGYFCLAGSTNATAVLCPAGSSCPTGSANATLCLPGRYSSSGAAVCLNCTAGRFGQGQGLTSSLCTGPCSAGYACPAGSPTATASSCAVGKYSEAGASLCTDCPEGTYGAVQGLATPLCTGLCAAGYACAPGSTNATAAACAQGKYSLAGAAACTSCPAGSYGETAALNTSACSGQCTAGYYCPSGSVNATAVVCPLGSFCPPAAGTPTPCGPGVFGNSTALVTTLCSGQCPAGYFCPGPTVTPIPCGNATVYCPSGSQFPLIVPPGFFSHPRSSPRPMAPLCR